MSIVGSNVLAGASGSGVSAYEIEQSVRFNRSDSPYIERDIVTTGNRFKATYSWWFKRGNLGTTQDVMFCSKEAGAGDNATKFVFDPSSGVEDKFTFNFGATDDTSYVFRVSDRLFRDPSAWYHAVVAVNTELSSDRVKLWINGELEGSDDSIPQYKNLRLSESDKFHVIGEDPRDNKHFEGYMAEWISLDGYAVTDPNDFGEFDDNGVWRPIEFEATPRAQYPSHSSTFESGWDSNANNPANSFNGNLADSTNRSGAGNTAWSGSIDTSGGTTIRLRAALGASSSQVGSATNLVKVNNTDVTAKLKTASAYTTLAWIDISTEAGDEITSLFIDAISGTSNPAIAAIDIDGEIVVDAESTGFGTNGFYLKFDPTATNGLSEDYSGNDNHFSAPVNIVTEGTATDVFSDTPTTNWATLNPLQTRGSSLSNGNLDASFTASDNNYASYITQGITSGKYYFEVTCNSSTTSASNIGFVGDNNLEAKRAANTNAVPGQHGTYGRGVDGTGTLYNGSGSSDGSYMAAWSQGDIIMVAIDADNEKFYLGANGKWADGSGNTDQSTLTSGAEISLSASTTPYLFGVGDSSGSVAADFTLNAGQREFATPPGTTSATDYFNTILYTGNGSTQSITGVGFQPDLVWIKKRDSSGNHMLADVVTGANKELNSNGNSAQADNTNALTSFDSDGFSVGSDGAVNINNEGLVAWCWKAGGTASANTDGTIDSSVSANNDAGFSVVTFTGTGTAGTVGHGLDTAPGVVMLRKLSGGTMGAGYSDWLVQFTSAGNVNQYVSLNSTSAFSESSSVFGAHPTSSVFSVGNNQISNNSGSEFVAYCWAEKTGVTKIGSYEGNGLVDGPTVDDIGFKPAMVIIKNVDAVDDWNIIDSKRDADDGLRPNSTSAEDAAVKVILTQSGFKVATADSHRINYSGETFVYIAFAENLAVDADFKSLNTANLPAPEVKDGSQHFDAKTYTANSSTAQSITGLNFSPDLLWFKTRSRSEKHIFYDTVRGAGDRWVNTANESGAEVTGDNSLTSFDSNGFSLGVDGAGIINNSTDTMVAWAWEKGSEYGFNIVEYTGDDEDGSGNIDVSHGLGVTPEFCIVRNLAGNEARVWHIGLGNTLASSGTPNPELRLTNNGGSSSPADAFRGFNSTIARFGANGGTNQDGDQHIAYFWTGVEGFSQFSTYTGNGSSDGPFVHTSFVPRFIILKKIESGGNGDWIIKDTARDPINVSDSDLRANVSNAEATSSARNIDILSNGFKLRTSDGDYNGSGDDFMVAAFAENPFGGDGVSPATAR